MKSKLEIAKKNGASPSPVQTVAGRPMPDWKLLERNVPEKKGVPTQQANGGLGKLSRKTMKELKNTLKHAGPEHSIAFIIENREKMGERDFIRLLNAALGSRVGGTRKAALGYALENCKTAEWRHVTLRGKAKEKGRFGLPLGKEMHERIVEAVKKNLADFGVVGKKLVVKLAPAQMVAIAGFSVLFVGAGAAIAWAGIHFMGKDVHILLEMSLITVTMIGVMAGAMGLVMISKSWKDYFGVQDLKKTLTGGEGNEKGY